MAVNQAEVTRLNEGLTAASCNASLREAVPQLAASEPGQSTRLPGRLDVEVVMPGIVRACVHDVGVSWAHDYQHLLEECPT